MAIHEADLSAQSPRQETAVSGQFVPGMRFLVFNFGGSSIHALNTARAAAYVRSVPGDCSSIWY
eukprot:3086695-Rhodomonas_salina.3